MTRLLKIAVNRKLASMCALLAILICLGTCIGGYSLYQDYIYQSYNEFAYQLCEVARTYVNGDRILSYLETKTEDEEYREMADNLYNLYKNTSLYDYRAGIYICVPDPEELVLTNIYDVRIEEYTEDDRDAVFGIGVQDPMGVDNVENALKTYLTGERVDDYFIHQTRFGYNSSAILPIYDSNGKIVAQIVTDMPIPYLKEALNRFLFSTIIITVVIVCLFMIAFLFIADKVLSRPLQIISEEADGFTRAEIQLSKRLPQIQQKDEIGMLAKSVYKMEQDIQNYVDNLTAVTAEKERIGAELNVATEIQASTLPCIFPAFPELPEFDIHATMTPAKEVGGDFYDFFRVDEDHIGLVIADVSGKGVPAALFMMISKTLLKSAVQNGLSAKDALERVNNQLCESNEADMFVTVWLGILEISTGTLTCANAGHEFPAVKHKGGQYELLKDPHGLVCACMEGSKYQEYQIHLEPGDTLFVYTDGVAEATDAHNELYGTDRLLAALNRQSETSCKELLQKVHEDINAFVAEAPQFDDITMLALHIKEK